MPLLKNTIINLPKTKLPSVLEVQGESVFDLYSYKEANSRVNFGEFIEKCLDLYQNAFRGVPVNVKQCFIEKNSLLKVDSTTKLIHTVEDDALRETEICHLVAKRIICKIGADTKSEMIPTLAISLSEKDEQIAFGNDVTICSNFTIFNRENALLSGRQLMGNVKEYHIKDLLKSIMPIFRQSEHNYEIDLASKEAFQQRFISKHEWYHFIGKMSEQIQYVNHARLNHYIGQVPKEVKELPITHNQLSSIIVEAVKPTYAEYAWGQDDTTSIWNVITGEQKC